MVDSTDEGISLRFISNRDKPLNQLYAQGLEGLNKPIKPLNQSIRKCKTPYCKNEAITTKTYCESCRKSYLRARLRKNKLREYYGGGR